ncbi:MAG: BatA and WFA domain-containing protein [Planctomycetota bacterium]
MTFATPLLAGIAAAVAIPTLLILYFLKLRRRDLEISSTLLWKKAIEDMQANAPFQRLRKNILLFLQLLALAAALFALAQPESERTASVGNRHVILIDRSASMSALDGSESGETRLDEAKRRAMEQVENFEAAGVFSSGGAADEAMVIAFDRTAEVVQRFTPDKALLRQAIESVEPTDVPGEIGEAFRLAQAHRPKELRTNDSGGRAEAATTEQVQGLVGGPPQTFHLFTDGRFADPEQFNPRSDDSVIYHRVGRDESANVAITGLRAERAYDAPENLSVFVALQNSAPSVWPVEVELLIDGAPVAIQQTRLPAADADRAVIDTDGEASSSEGGARPVATTAQPGTGGVVFELSRPQRAEVSVRVRTPPGFLDAPIDSLALDDRGALVVPPAEQTALAVVTPGNAFLIDVLGALPLAALDDYTPAEWDALRDETKERYDVVLLDRVLPGDIPEGRGLPAGRWLALGAIPVGPEALSFDGEGGVTSFLDWRRDHPVLRPLTLAGVEIGELLRVSIPENSLASVIADTTRGPGIIEINAPDYRAIVVAFNPGLSTWPIDVSFLVFLAYAIDDLGSAGERLGTAISQRLSPGDILVDRLPTGSTGARVELPSGERRDLAPAPDGRISFGPLKQAGVYEVSWTGEGTTSDEIDGSSVTRRYAVNLLDPGESDIAPLSSEQLAGRVFAEQVREAQAASVARYWPWLLLGALGLMLLEWYVYNRKVQL